MSYKQVENKVSIYLALWVQIPMYSLRFLFSFRLTGLLRHLKLILLMAFSACSFFFSYIVTLGFTKCIYVMDPKSINLYIFNRYIYVYMNKLKKTYLCMHS